MNSNTINTTLKKDKLDVYCIIPVYNTAKYLRKCVDSVLKQTYRNVEIILVNDASTDNSAKICAKYQTLYPDRIHFINKPKNEGVDKARFTGLEYVFGKCASSVGSTRGG